MTLLVDSLSVEVSNLQSSRTEVQRQYEAKVVALESSERGKQDLQIKLDQQTASFRDESSKLHAAVQSLEIRSSDDRENVEQFEQAFRQAEEKHRRLLDEAEGVADEAIRAKEAAIQRMKEMEQAVETLSAAYPDGGSSAISATANVLAQAQETGQTIGQIYINSARNAMALNKANEEISRLEAVLKEVVLEISSKVGITQASMHPHHSSGIDPSLSLHLGTRAETAKKGLRTSQSRGAKPGRPAESDLAGQGYCRDCSRPFTGSTCVLQG